MKVYSYQRFSSEKQRDGDSIRRQTEMANAWLARNPSYVLDNSITFADEGKSGFKGANLAEGGKLNLFLKMVDSGKIPNDSALMVESFDRLSRLPMMEANELFSGIIRRGLTVIFLSPERIINRKSIDENPFSLIEILITGIRANEESQTKSKRIKAAVETRKKATNAGKALQFLCPPWCDLENGKYIPNKSKVKTIARIFELYLEGNRAYRIAKILNAEKHGTFGRGSTTSKKGTINEWYKIYINRLLKDKRLIGHCEFANSENHYPVVIDTDIFNRAQARTRKPVTHNGRPNNGQINLFRGLLRCGACNGSATRGDKVRFGYLHRYVCCEGARTGKGCKYSSFKYDYIENSFFQIIDNSDAMFEAVDPIAKQPNESIAIQEKLNATTVKRDKFFSIIENDPNPSHMMVQRLKALEAEVETLKSELMVAKGKELEKLNGPSEYCEIRNNFHEWVEDPKHREKISEYISGILEKIVIRFHESPYPAYTAYFKNGHRCTVTIAPITNRAWNFQIHEGNTIAFDAGETTVYTGDTAETHKPRIVDPKLAAKRKS